MYAENVNGEDRNVDGRNQMDIYIPGNIRVSME